MFCRFWECMFASPYKALSLLRFYLVVLVCTGLSIPASAQTCTGIPDSECQALYDFYNSTQGDRWTTDDNWLTGAHVNDWYGVAVQSGHVVNIQLMANHMHGSIPSTISNLTHLHTLMLYQNFLTGEIPQEIGTMTSLQTLYLYTNSLSGEIPPELGNLTNLKNFSLGWNNLTGEIPPELGNLGNIEQLVLWGNNLTGEIPSELGNLTNLVWLHLYSNDLTGEIPSEFGNLDNLAVVNCSHNMLTGNIPSEMGNIASLVNLDFSSNKLSGDLPAFLASPPQETKLGWNCLHASNPAVLAAMESKHNNQFMSTQTVPPENVTVEVFDSSGTAENRVLVSWDPITYVNDDGGYQVYYKRTFPPAENSGGASPGEQVPAEGDSGSDYYYHGMTADKNATSLVVSNLEPGVNYTFRVNTLTRYHAFNRKDLMSPDSNTVTAVSGTLARAFIPVWKQAAEYFTGVVVSNFGSSGFNLNMAAYDTAGVLEPLGQNPVSTTVGAGLQKSLLGWEFFQGDPYHEDVSWIEIEAENSNRMGSIFLYGVNDTQLLDGAESQTAYGKKLFFTRPADEGFFDGWDPDIQMCIVNPTDQEVTVKCWLKATSGASTEIHTIPPGGFVAGDVQDLSRASGEIADAYLDIEVTDGPGVVGFSRIEFPGVRTALGMNAVPQSTVLKMYSAQLAHGMNIVTHLRLVNTASAARNVTLTAVGDDGSLLAEAVDVYVAAWSVYDADLGTLFDLPGEGVITTGSLVVETDGSGVIGDIIFADGDTLGYAMSLQLQERLFKEAVFNHIANLPTVFTGFAFFNPGEITANVLVEAFGTDGSKVAEMTLVLDPGERIARTLTDPDIWPAFPTQSGGFIRIQSDQPIAGQQLFGDKSLRYMAAIPPTTRVEPMFVD